MLFFKKVVRCSLACFAIIRGSEISPMLFEIDSVRSVEVKEEICFC